MGTCIHAVGASWCFHATMPKRWPSWPHATGSAARLLCATGRWVKLKMRKKTSSLRWRPLMVGHTSTIARLLLLEVVGWWLHLDSAKIVTRRRPCIAICTALLLPRQRGCKVPEELLDVVAMLGARLNEHDARLLCLLFALLC